MDLTKKLGVVKECNLKRELELWIDDILDCESW